MTWITLPPGPERDRIEALFRAWLAQKTRRITLDEDE